MDQYPPQGNYGQQQQAPPPYQQQGQYGQQQAPRLTRRAAIPRPAIRPSSRSTASHGRAGTRC